MNEIVTPPGYVEYPRDPKFRAPDPFQRLELLGVGLSQLKWWAFLLAIELGLIGHGQPFSLAHVVFNLMIGFYLVMFLSTGLKKVCQANRWPLGYAYLVPLVPAALGILYKVGVVEHWGFGAAYAAVLVGIWFGARAVVDREFRRFGVKLPFSLSEFQARSIVEGLRSAVQSAPAIELG